MTLTDISSKTYRRSGGGSRRRGRAHFLLPLTVILVLAAAVALIVYVLWPRWPGIPVAPGAPTIPITIAGVHFNVPPAAIRVPVQRRPGTHERVDLAFLWPSLEPPDPGAKAATPAPAAPARPLQRIFVTIANAGDTLDPADRIVSIYPRYAAPDAVPGPGGLTVLAFRDDSPYRGEDLIYDATAPGFLVRCTREGAGATPGTCFSERRIGGADLTVRFPRDWLDDWRSVAGGIDRLIARLRPPHE